MESFDIVLLGTGIAGTLTLIEVCNKLVDDTSLSQPMQIAAVEKHAEFWKGIPYGSRSSVNALTITSVADFINEKEYEPFFGWLLKSKEEWLPHMLDNGGVTAQRWADNNMPAILRQDWSAVYVPRFLYGMYLSSKLKKVVAAAVEKGKLELIEIHAEALDIIACENGEYDVALKMGDGLQHRLHATKVVISTGSAPVNKLCDIGDMDVLYLNDFYDPSEEENLKSIKGALAKVAEEKDRNILVVGSNASSIELLYLLEGRPDIKSLLNKIVVISTSGALPYHTSTQQLDSHPLPALETLEKKGGYDIVTLVDAAEKDMQLALTDGANMDYVATLIKTTLKMMESLGEQAKKEFFGIHALRLRDKFRRAGPEYKNIAQNWLDSSSAILLKGRFINLTKCNNGVRLVYKNTGTGNLEEYPLQFSAVVNCTGSADLDISSSAILFNIVNKKLCKMNLSRKGIEVNEKFEAAPNLYVMGPLLGGNVNKLIHFWQLENASRLTYLAPFLANELVASSL